MYVPVIPPTGKNGKNCSSSSPSQAIALAIGTLMFFVGIGVAIYMKKGGGSIGLMELTILGAIIVLALGGIFIVMRPRSDDEPSKSRGSDSRPID